VSDMAGKAARAAVERSGNELDTKARTRTHTAARKPLYHQRVANGTVRNCLGRIGISCGFLFLASLARRTRRSAFTRHAIACSDVGITSLRLCRFLLPNFYFLLS
jgi:hypothetical protein